VEWLDLHLPWSGAWSLCARVDLEGDDALAIGPLSLVFDDGSRSITYSGTILSSSADEGTGSIVAVGGAGGLRKRIAGEDYTRPPPRIVIAAILSACGETLGDVSTIETLPLIEPSYQRLVGRADRQIDALCELVGLRWYVAETGRVNVELPTWPTYERDAFLVRLRDINGERRAEPDVADIMPGMIVEGERVASVRYVLNEDGLTAMLGGVPS
jgi:hypothetical protein